jgi:hypothetical protein
LYFVTILNSEVAYSCCLVENPFNVSLSVMTRSGFGLNWNQAQVS